VRSYYTGKHAVQYNQNWQAFLQKTLDAAYEKIDVEALKRRVQNRQATLRILDAACGTGLFLQRLAHLFPAAQLYGIDASEEMLAQARELLHDSSNVHLYHTQLCGDATARLPYPPAFFDLIACTNTLHYLQKPAAVLRGFNTLLVEQGQLVLEDYILRGPSSLWKVWEPLIRLYDPEHRSLFTPEQGQSLCQQANFRVVIAQKFPIDRFCQGWSLRATA
jgi:SAM-dependent methyltransferase